MENGRRWGGENKERVGGGEVKGHKLVRIMMTYFCSLSLSHSLIHYLLFLFWFLSFLFTHTHTHSPLLISFTVSVTIPADR